MLKNVIGFYNIESDLYRENVFMHIIFDMPLPSALNCHRQEIPLEFIAHQI